MPWVFFPGYGIWPRPRARIIGQANPDLLGSASGMSGEPSFTVDDDRPAIRFPDMSPEGLDVHRRMSEAFGVDPSRRHGFDALLELVEEDERAFKNPTSAQAEAQAERMAETVRELAQRGIAHDVDWLEFTSPEIRNGLPTVVIGVNRDVVEGTSDSGVPLVRVRGKLLPVAPSKIHGRKVEFHVGKVVPHSDLSDDGVPDRLRQAKTKLKRLLGAERLPWPTWLVGVGITGVGPGQGWNALRVDVLPGAQNDAAAASVPGTVDGVPVVVERMSMPVMQQTRGDDMGSITTLNTDIMGATLNSLLIERMDAYSGVYVRDVDASWKFVLDPSLRLWLRMRGVNAPCSVPANKLVCWNTVPSQPLIGGFTHPETGFHCRSTAIPVEWDTLTHGDPVIRLTGGNGGLADGDPYDPNDPEEDMSGMADATTTPLQRAQALAIQINTSIGVLAGTPPQWWLYTLPVVTDSKPVVKVGIKGNYQPDAKELKALPWANWVSHGVEIDMEFVPPVGSTVKGTVAKIMPTGVALAGLADGLSSAPIDKVWPTDSTDYHEPVGDSTGDDDPAMGCCGSSVTLADLATLGQSSYGWAARTIMPSKYAQPPLLGPPPARRRGPPAQIRMFYDDGGGMGSAPLVAMPTGTLNWDRVTGYEGQPWVMKDWSGQDFMGDVAPAAAPSAGIGMGSTLGLGLASAAIGAAAGWFLAPQGTGSKTAAAVGGIGGGLAGLLVGKLFSSAAASAAASTQTPVAST